MTPKELHNKIKRGNGPTVVDVRSGMEYRLGHIPAALHLPLWKVVFRLTGSLPKHRDATLLIVCESGARSQMAADLLRKRGYTNIVYLEGDMAGWRRAGLAMER